MRKERQKETKKGEKYNINEEDWQNQSCMIKQQYHYTQRKKRKKGKRKMETNCERMKMQRTERNEQKTGIIKKKQLYVFQFI